MDEERRTVVRAVLASDLNRLLGVENTDTRTCFVCQRQVVPEELGGFVKVAGEVRLFCNRVTCLVAAERGNWRNDSQGNAPDVP